LEAVATLLKIFMGLHGIGPLSKILAVNLFKESKKFCLWIIWKMKKIHIDSVISSKIMQSLVPKIKFLPFLEGFTKPHELMGGKHCSINFVAPIFQNCGNAKLFCCCRRYC
jgi:hypothetical protein